MSIRIELHGGEFGPRQKILEKEEYPGPEYIIRTTYGIDWLFKRIERKSTDSAGRSVILYRVINENLVLRVDDEDDAWEETT